MTVFFSLTLLDFALYFAVDHGWLIVAYFLAMIPIKALISAWNHHHQHVPMFYSKPLNRLLEMSFALHTGATTNAWTLHHVHGHHKNYLDQEKDESRWRRGSGETFGFVAYTFITVLTAYPRAHSVGRNHPRLRRAFVGYAIVTLLLVGTLVAFKPVNGLFLFAFPPLISLIITVAATYLHHSGLDTDDHMTASRNYTATFRNVLTGNLGYHTAHHYRQGMHWSKLPELHATIADRIPDAYVQA
ncbi:MAG: fatty acid desaturase family protein [Acidimicrobiales bacterium]